MAERSLVQTRVPSKVLRWIERQAKPESVAAWLRMKLTAMAQESADGQAPPSVSQRLALELRSTAAQLRSGRPADVTPEVLAVLFDRLASELDRHD